MPHEHELSTSELYFVPISELTIEQFCRKYKDDHDGRTLITSMYLKRTMENAWSFFGPIEIIWIIGRELVFNNHDRRRFACKCARHIWNMFGDKRSQIAIEVAERFCDGTANDDELKIANNNAKNAHELSLNTAVYNRYLTARIAHYASSVHVPITEIAMDAAKASTASFYAEICWQAALVREMFPNPFAK